MSSEAYLRRDSHNRPLGMAPPPSPDIERLRAKAREIKQTKGLSIEDLVLASGLSRRAVLDLLHGHGHVAVGRVDTWWRLAWALEVPLSVLIGALDESDKSVG